MNFAKVWNDNTVAFTQEFKGETITIPAQSFIEMDYSEAVSFKSYPAPMVFDGMGQQTRESLKMLRVEPPANLVGANTVVAYRCHKDGSLHGSKEELAKYEASLDEGAFADPIGAQIAKKGKGQAAKSLEA